VTRGMRSRLPSMLDERIRNRCAVFDIFMRRCDYLCLYVFGAAPVRMLSVGDCTSLFVTPALSAYLQSLRNVNGLERFGLTEATVQCLIQTLPNADRCKAYVPRAFGWVLPAMSLLSCWLFIWVLCVYMCGPQGLA
jgi:hypothetical protein